MNINEKEISVLQNSCLDPEISKYALELPSLDNIFSPSHASQLHYFQSNNTVFFLFWELTQSGPIFLPDGTEGWYIEHVIDEKKLDKTSSIW